MTECVIPSAPPDRFDDVIATADGQPIWVTICTGRVRHDTCWISDSWIKPGDCVFQHLNGSRFMNLLPLLEWLRSISDYHHWQQPALRACFMFDDPNLHATKYGFVGFEQLATEGKRHRYHCSFATVPLDGYYVSGAAARIFRDNRQNLSLLIHGNNHTYRELAGRESPARQHALMHQAVFRIGQLEQKSGLAVSRVMAPPHGVCSAEMMAAMMRAGLEAVCVSHGSVWTGNMGAGWTIALGANPAMIVEGLPVIPRFGLDRKMENSILLAAYLNQPIVSVGHHWDLADGLDILSSAAHFINGIGSVIWSDMAAIARSNYCFHIRGCVMRVRMFSRVMSINVPTGVSELQLEATWLDPLEETIECQGCERIAPPCASGNLTAGLRIFVTPGSCVEVAVNRTTNRSGPLVSLPRTRVSVVTRKILVELRDRCMPLIRRGLSR